MRPVVFDAVTVAEVAEAANVSKMTVFNYFPHKEELIFDRHDEVTALIGAALRDRPPGRPVAAVLHRLLLDLIESRHPLGDVPGFWQTVVDSPALRSAARNSADEQEQALVGLLRETVERKPDDPPDELVAAMLVALYRTVYRQAITATLAGRSADEIRPRVLAMADQAFALLTSALGDYGTRQATAIARDLVGGSAGQEGVQARCDHSFGVLSVFQDRTEGGCC
jgi:AcrR family transcriptional regulator